MPSTGRVRKGPGTGNLALLFLILLSSECLVNASTSIEQGVKEQHALHTLSFLNSFKGVHDKLHLNGHVQHRLAQRNSETGEWEIPHLSTMLTKIKEDSFASHDEASDLLTQVLDPLFEHGSQADMQVFLRQSQDVAGNPAAFLHDAFGNAVFNEQGKSAPHQSGPEAEELQEHLAKLTSLLQTESGTEGGEEWFRRRHHRATPTPQPVSPAQPNFLSRWYNKARNSIKNQWNKIKSKSTAIKTIGRAGQAMRELAKKGFRCPRNRACPTYISNTLASTFGFFNGVFFGMLDGMRKNMVRMQRSPRCQEDLAVVNAAFVRFASRPGLLVRGLMNKHLREGRTHIQHVLFHLKAMWYDFEQVLGSVSTFVVQCSEFRALVLPVIITVIIGAIMTGVLLLFPGIAWIPKLAVMLISFIFGLPFLGQSFAKFWRGLKLCLKGECDLVNAQTLLEGGGAIVGFIVVTVLVSGPEFVSRVKGLKELFKTMELSKKLNIRWSDGIYKNYKMFSRLISNARTIVKGDPAVAVHFDAQLKRLLGRTPAVLVEALQNGLRAGQWRIPHQWLEAVNLEKVVPSTHDAQQANPRTAAEKFLRKREERRRQEAERNLVEKLPMSTLPPESESPQPPMSTLPPDQSTFSWLIPY
eukprot:TRINITY_DN2464_c0_g1_i1.p1 TRINITY_DN2464_c0_g1~~TRINITY_DN2464_c0_g1_i1.p1  ORF type:complete len:641 (+),score=138.87 TRINITY_DN2464_c0_g1_i1:245-2167(+)